MCRVAAAVVLLGSGEEAAQLCSKNFRKKRPSYSDMFHDSASVISDNFRKKRGFADISFC